MASPLSSFSTHPGDEGRAEFDRAMDALRADVTAMAAMATNDGHVRMLYNRQTQALSRQLQAEVHFGRMAWKEAAEKGRLLRGDIMQIIRRRTSPIGKARAEQMKAQNTTEGTLLERKSKRLFKKTFDALSPAQREQVYADIVRSTGTPDPVTNAKVARWSRIGRGLIVLALAVSAYNIAVAEDHAAQATEEAAVMGAGIAGGVAFGAGAGLLCGPGSPVCVTIGAFVGGALTAFGVSMAFE